MLAARKVGSKLPRHADIEDFASMLNRLVVMNRFFVLTSCFHAEPSHFHVYCMLHAWIPEDGLYRGSAFGPSRAS